MVVANAGMGICKVLPMHCRTTCYSGQEVFDGLQLLFAMLLSRVEFTYLVREVVESEEVVIKMIS